MPEPISAILAIVAGIDPLVAAAAFCLVVLGAIVQSCLGMGFGLAAAPLLAVLDPSLVPAVPLLLGTVVAVRSAARARGAIAFGEFRVATLGRMAGTVLATVLLARLLDRDAFAIIFAVCIVVAVVLNVFSIGLAFRPRNILAMSTLSGVMGTITSVGGPPMALLYKDRPPLGTRATMSAFFAFGGIMSLAGVWAAGWIAAPEVVLSCLLLPGVVVGARLAELFQPFVDGRFSNMLMALVCVSAVVLLARALVG